MSFRAVLPLCGVILSGWLAGRGEAEGVEFQTHALAADSQFSACAVFDVNHDGRLDVVSGGYWYEAPGWKRHVVREVEQIRGRFDDYSNLPLDVNADGWLDLVSVNYRSKSLYWVEHPGPGLGLWKKHEIDVPGPMETGRLVDVDGDGRLDVLPNGTTFAAWWELEPSAEPGRPGRWIRHELPAEIAGHGIGAGDINGDGRLDLVGPRGWLEAPEDRRRGRWVWHPEFYLGRDASIPILVLDVDGDGDQDLVWGRGHRVGVYWLEQQADRQGTRRWTRHAIDTRVSQSHSPLLGDLTGDGRPEVVIVKRYLGHDGRDIGEYDPLGIYWYSFQPDSRTWRRGTISESKAAGALDPKLADLDGDGDLDLVTADINGLYWCENRGAGQPVAGPSSREATPDYRDHADLLFYLDAERQRQEVKLPADWGLRRLHILNGMQQAMGRLPGSEARVPLEPQTLEETDLPRYVQRKITFAAEPNDRVPAWLLLPKGLQGPAPAMLCLHQTTGIGKGEPAGLGGLPTLHYARELAERGYVCLVPDYPSFGDYAYDFKTQGSHYLSGSMKAIWNNLRAVDLLESLPEVDGDRIGCIGHSLGGHNSLFTAAFDQRLRAVVTSCGFTPFHHYYGGKLAGWTSDRYMPRIRDEYQNDPDRMPFDFYGVLAAIAPRAIFVNAPLHDSNFEVEGVRKVMQTIPPVFQLYGAEGRLRAEYPDTGHEFPDAVRQQAYAWLDEQLRP